MVRAVPLSRRALEMRFRHALGRTVHAEIQRVHVERARMLLVTTDLPMPKVAQSSGFANADYALASTWGRGATLLKLNVRDKASTFRPFLVGALSLAFVEDKVTLRRDAGIAT